MACKRLQLAAGPAKHRVPDQAAAHQGSYDFAFDNQAAASTGRG